MANGISEASKLVKANLGLEISSDGIWPRGRYPQLPCKKDLQHCLGGNMAKAISEASKLVKANL